MRRLWLKIWLLYPDPVRRDQGTESRPSFFLIHLPVFHRPFVRNHFASQPLLNHPKLFGLSCQISHIFRRKNPMPPGASR